MASLGIDDEDKKFLDWFDGVFWPHLAKEKAFARESMGKHGPAKAYWEARFQALDELDRMIDNWDKDEDEEEEN